jgi:hypothetical protein
VLTTLTFLLAFAAADPGAVAPTVTADLDGDGVSETVTAVPSPGSVRLQVRDAGGRRLAEAKAPAPSADVVPVALTAAPIGSAGALLEVDAATDTSACLSVWRYNKGALERLPIRDAAGKPLADCERAGEWTFSWESEAPGRPSALVRERVERVPAGELRTRDTFAFAGFSLDRDPRRSRAEINGIPIPSWYRTELYTRPALERLYGRFGLAALGDEPTLTIEADPRRGVFALRFAGRDGDLVVPVESYASASDGATLSVRAAGKTGHVTIRFAGDGSIPYEVHVEGLGARRDQVYSPAGTWRGGARQVYPTAADELASQYLAGVWGNEKGQNTAFSAEGEPPHRIRIGPTAYTLDMANVAPPVDLVLHPVDAKAHPWGLVLRGPNGLDRIPYACDGDAPTRACRATGPAERLRRIGARVNVR